MIKKNIKIILYTLLCVVIFFACIFALYGGFRGPTSPSEMAKHGQLQLNDELLIEQPDTAEQMDDDTSSDEINLIGYYDIVDLFTISALDQMYPEIRTYLNQHGYADAFNLTIIESSIESNRGYPRFICQVEDTNAYLEVRYDISKKQYEFQISQK